MAKRKAAQLDAGLLARKGEAAPASPAAPPPALHKPLGTKECVFHAKAATDSR